MGDRNNLIKFGPEWLRNLSRERNASSASNSQNSAPSGITTTASASGASGGGTATSTTASSTTASSNTASPHPKVQLAKLRYGREEMLALYDRTSEAPAELKYIDILYQPRGKPPVALNNSFEEEMRDTMRTGPPLGPMPGGERFGIGRGMGRGANVSEARGRAKVPFVRQLSAGRTVPWHLGSLRMPGYGGGADDEAASTLRSWASNNGGNATARSSGGPEQPEWTSNKLYRTKRPGSTTNWRQSREDEEWRVSDNTRSRSAQQEKWDRDWGDRPSSEKPQSWSNRRNWVGGDSQSTEENLPEWAVDSAEAGAGTFDASGAFHGYSNDDSNLPKSQESAFALTRSHTQGSFARTKTMEEGSEEWWASEKAKKLSPKRFDASDIKFKKTNSVIPEIGTNTSSSNKTNSSKDESSESKAQEKPDTPTSSIELTENSGSNVDDNYNKKVRFTESKTFDALMRSDINLEEASDERGNFQSVMITPNNSLRQKHQNMVPANNISNRQNRQQPGILRLIQNSSGNQSAENEQDIGTSETNVVDDIMQLTLENKSNVSQSSSSTPGISSAMQPVANSITQISSPMTSQMSAQLTSQINSAIQLRLLKPDHPTQGLTMAPKSNISASNVQATGLQTSGMQSSGLQSAIGLQSSGLQSGLQPSGLQTGLLQSGLQPSGLQSGLQSSGLQSSGLPSGLQSSGLHSGLQTSGLQSGLQSSGLHSGLHSSGLQSGLQSSGLQSGLQSSGLQSALQSSGLQSALQSSGLQSGLQSSVLQSGLQSSGLQSGLQSSGIQQVGITNSALNASLGLPLGPSNNPLGQAMGIPLQNIPPPLLSNQGMSSTGLQTGGQLIAGLIPRLTGPNVVNNSLFLGQNANPTALQANDMQMNQGAQANLFPLHGLQHSGSQTGFNSGMYGNIMQQNSVPQQPTNSQILAEQWYYEDPKQNIQGPFSSKEMYSWYRAGFFSETLMVRRACDTIMRPLGSYGPVVPFVQLDMIPSFPMRTNFEAASRESLITHGSTGLGLDVFDVSNLTENCPMDSMQFGTVGIRNPPFGQQHMVDLWSQPSSDLMWMQQALNARNDTRVNNLPMFFWDQQPSAIGSNALLPDEITKEMKTEDQILAQLRASQNIPVPPPKIPFPSKQPVPPPPPSSNPEDTFPSNVNVAPHLEELQKFIKEDTLKEAPSAEEAKVNDQTPQRPEDTFLPHENQLDSKNQVEQPTQNKSVSDSKIVKQSKTEGEKTTKNKENSITKNKNNKKSKDDKKEDSIELKTKENEVAKAEKRSAEPSPSKCKKDDKTNKKELEKEKKEWLKEGFTIVNKTEKPSTKDKKKTDENKVAEEAERKRREEERLAAEEEKKRRQAEALKKQQDLQQQQQQRQAVESIMKKAPWSAVANQAMQQTNKEGMTLAEIQRLEREKKLEQMKEQQQMMQIIAQQQAAALAREQEMQAGLGWAKKKANSLTTGQSLAEIQAEARKQAVMAAAAAAAQSQALEEAQALNQQAQINNMPWGSSHNGGGFWDTQPNQPTKSQEPPKQMDTNKNKKKTTVTTSISAKKEVTPSAEFETWCTTVLTSWSSKIDVPTFVGFLKDIESPYEVKDYVKCYLGDSKDSNDFARQFLERRSKLLRVGMVTPSDDLCSPAIAVNPRTPSGSDYQEVKSKGKKTKKNKMLKVDARILGFSVTAAEDRINVGDIDTV